MAELSRPRPGPDGGFVPRAEQPPDHVTPHRRARKCYTGPRQDPSWGELEQLLYLSAVIMEGMCTLVEEMAVSCYSAIYGVGIK